jgi:hypothetical protein
MFLLTVVLSIEERVFFVQYVFREGNRYTDLTPPDCYLWRKAKCAVCRDRPVFEIPMSAFTYTDKKKIQGDKKVSVYLIITIQKQAEILLTVSITYHYKVIRIGDNRWR